MENRSENSPISDDHEGENSAVAQPTGEQTPRLAASHGDQPLPDSDVQEKGIEDALGESLDIILDIRQWNEGTDLAALYSKMKVAVAESVAQSERTRDPIRQLLQASLREQAGQGTVPESAGLYHITPEDVACVHSHALFNGATECCDGTVVAHDSLLLTVAQIGVSLVAYQGSAGRWVQRLYRRDLRAHYPDPMEEAEALLNSRKRSDSADSEETRDPISRLLRRGLMEYAERAVLLHHATAPWRMGHGNPIPGLILMMNFPSLFYANLQVLEDLYLGHRRFVYVASSPANRMVRTLGDSLMPLEYAIVGSLEDQFPNDRIDSMTNPMLGLPAQRAKLRKFLHTIRSEIVYGVYRVALESPAQVFYAHKDHAHEAASIVIADSVLQAHRGFPLLIDLADLVCGNTFDAASFQGTVQDAYSAAGQPLRYLGERETRGR